MLHIGLQLPVIGVEPVGQAIFVGRENSTGLEQAERLAIDACLVRRTAGPFDGIGGIERGVRRIDLHEIAFEPVGEMAQARHLAPLRGAFELQHIVVDADDPSSGETGDLYQRPANATAQIDRRHAGAQAELVGDVMFVARERRGEALVCGARREVEGLTPAVFEEVGDQVVIGAFECPVVHLARVQTAAPP